jgi:hypothetical protein
MSATATLSAAAEAHLSQTTAGSILVRNSGGYVARFSLTYNLNGHDFTKDSGDFSLGVNKSVDIPTGATNIRLKVEEMWGFGWSTIFTKTFAEPVTKCYKVYGTTLDPKYEEISC